MRNSEKTPLSKQAFQRMPYYLQYLKEISKTGAQTVSSPTVAAHFNFTEIQVRKDFAAVCTSRGIPKQGFEIKQLISDIEKLLGYGNTNEAALVGVGTIGSALLQYSGIEKYGTQIVVAFDNDDKVIGKEVGGRKIMSSDKLVDLCKRMQIHIGIITVPADQAQDVCDQLIEGGVLAIWNFAPIHLSVPDGTLVHNEEIAASLALLSRRLQEKMKKMEAE